jgi:hypothetical protein
MLSNLIHRGDDLQIRKPDCIVFGHSGEYTPNFGVYNKEAVNVQQSDNSTQRYTLGGI